MITPQPAFKETSPTQRHLRGSIAIIRTFETRYGMHWRVRCRMDERACVLLRAGASTPRTAVATLFLSGRFALPCLSRANLAPIAGQEVLAQGVSNWHNISCEAGSGSRRGAALGCAEHMACRKPQGRVIHGDVLLGRVPILRARSAAGPQVANGAGTISTYEPAPCGWLWGQ